MFSYFEDKYLLENNCFFENNEMILDYQFNPNQLFPNSFESLDHPFKYSESEKEEGNDDKFIRGNDNINVNDQPTLNQKKINQKTKPTSNSKDKTTITVTGKIFQISKENKKTLIGHKRKFNYGGKHDKFCYDNVTRKAKTKFFDAILSFVNASIEPIQIKNPKKYSKKKLYSKPFLLKTNQNIIKTINVVDNQKLLNSKLRDIFSEDISSKLSNYGLDYNRKLIKKIETENIQKKTIAILQRTFLECLEQFRGSKNYKELQGLEKEYEYVINGLKQSGESEEYIEMFIEFVSRFENYYLQKKPRPLRYKKKDN